MSVPRLKGWAPIRLYWRGSEPWVDWCFLGTQRFADFFFESTIFGALELPFNTLFRHQTPISVLEEWHSKSPGLQPSAFIFHSSRCGSTLVSQMLAALSQTIVLSEPPPVDVLARSYLRSPDAPIGQRTSWLQWMVSALGQRRTGAESHYFIKFEPRTTLELPLLRHAFPDVPWIFLYRDPVEVLVSLLTLTAPLTTPGFTVPDPLGLDPTQLTTISSDEYAARMLGKLTEAAVLRHDEMCRLVNYSQLPDILWNGLDRHFGMTFTASDIERMRRQCSFHAKAPGQPFQSDTERKNQEASDRLRLLADQWIMSHYRTLEEIRQGQAT